MLNELPLSRKIAVYRAIRNMTQQELAAQIPCDRAIISRWECGVTQPCERDLERLAIVLGIENENLKEVEK
jgi:transcriptional regulator with XRE-family HTH domain